MRCTWLHRMLPGMLRRGFVLQGWRGMLGLNSRRSSVLMSMLEVLGGVVDCRAVKLDSRDMHVRYERSVIHAQYGRKRKVRQSR